MTVKHCHKQPKSRSHHQDDWQLKNGWYRYSPNPNNGGPPFNKYIFSKIVSAHTGGKPMFKNVILKKNHKDKEPLSLCIYNLINLLLWLEGKKSSAFKHPIHGSPDWPVSGWDRGSRSRTVYEDQSFVYKMSGKLQTAAGVKLWSLKSNRSTSSYTITCTPSRCNARFNTWYHYHLCWKLFFKKTWNHDLSSFCVPMFLVSEE